MNTPNLGVCYYPEHWPESVWAEDAVRMVELGLSIVRIGEFAWSRLEPSRNDFQFEWLERAIDTLHAAGLKVVLGTPTATPPKWLVNEMPDMIPIDQYGNPRNFGSRRHYDFSHQSYAKECARIVTSLAKRFGNHPGIIAWQTDNEYGCHDTSLSWSPCALNGFRQWLKEKYQTPESLNQAWGNVFWSMEISSFDQMELPNLTVTEANPAHRLDFHRYSSDMIVRFNQMQANIIREHSPGRDIIHNFMGRTVDFDHFDVGADLDISSWDSYPLGFLDEREDVSEEWHTEFARSGDPDFQAFHHDLYRATSKGRWWVMEQQPGPVNWAAHNPAPNPGMIRLWTWEAFAHGAETVSFFRWRQAPFAQEQMHAGLLRPDSVEADAYAEVKAVAEELKALGLSAAESNHADVAIVFDYPSAWAWKIQPQAKEFDYLQLILHFYSTLRQLGFSIDIIPATTKDLSPYKLVLIPGLFAWNDNLIEAMEKFKGKVLIGPRSGSKTQHFSIPERLPPSLPASLLDARISKVETLRNNVPVPVQNGGSFELWREFVDCSSDNEIEIRAEDGHAALLSSGNISYLAGWPDTELLNRVISDLTQKLSIKTTALPHGVRLRRNGDHIFALNYGSIAFNLTNLGWHGEPVLGSMTLEPANVTVVTTKQAAIT